MIEKVLLYLFFAGAVYYVFIGPLIFIYKSKQREKKHFAEEFAKFNSNRFNPLNVEFYKTLYDYTFDVNMILITGSKEVGGGNQRDGDELITNSSRNPITRISDHQDFDRFKKGSTIIHGLGYNFKKKENFEAFVKLFLDNMPVGVICLPINKTWAVFIKREDGNVNLSFDQSILTNNDYRYLTME